MRSIPYPLKNRYLLSLLVLMTIFTPVKADAELVEGIVAVVDDSLVMVSDLERKMKEMRAPDNEAAAHSVLKLMVENIVIEKIYKGMGLPGINREEATNVASRGKISLQDANALIMKSTLMDIMVRSRVVITEKMIFDYYNSNEDYSGRDSVHLKQILIKKDQQKAAKARQEIDSGRTFDDVAAEYSDLLISGGSDIGWIALENLSEDARTDIEDAKDGDIIGPIEINQFFAIYMLVQRDVAGGRAFEDVSEDIRVLLEDKYSKEAFDHWLNRIMTEHFIGIYM